MNTQHVTAAGTFPVAEPLGDRAYLAYGLRGTSLGGALVELQYSPDGTSWATFEGHSSAATPALAIGSFRAPVYAPGAHVRLLVAGGSGVDFWFDFAVGQI